MNHTQKESKTFFSQLEMLYEQNLNTEEKKTLIEQKLKTVLFPSYLSLETSVQASRSLYGMQIGSQNTCWKDVGAFTGEVSAIQLLEIGVEHTLVGHSERRQFFGESNETVKNRAEHLIEKGFSVMLCIGETLSERDSGKTFTVLEEQLSSIFTLSAKKEVFKNALGNKLSIAYEPVWAIGTGKTATPEQAEEAHFFIREFLRKHLGAVYSEKASVLYGGSVKPDNLKELLSCANIDGALVGGASLKAADFFQMVQTAVKFF